MKTTLSGLAKTPMIVRCIYNAVLVTILTDANIESAAIKHTWHNVETEHSYGGTPSTQTIGYVTLEAWDIQTPMTWETHASSATTTRLAWTSHPSPASVTAPQTLPSPTPTHPPLCQRPKPRPRPVVKPSNPMAQPSPNPQPDTSVPLAPIMDPPTPLLSTYLPSGPSLSGRPVCDRDPAPVPSLSGSFRTAPTDELSLWPHQQTKY